MEEIITLNNEKYVIVTRLEHDSKNYIYASSIERTDTVAVLEEYEKDDKKLVKSVEQDKLNLIMNLFSKIILEEN